jgi:hypothetical protein
MDSVAQNFPPKIVAEGELVDRLGVSRPVLRLLRDELLQEGADWELRDKQIWLNEPAVTKIADGYRRLKPASLAELKNGPSSVRLDQKKGPPASPAVVLHELRVWKADGYAGGHILLARTVGGKSVRVRVRSTANFCPGMILYGRQLNEELYEFAGPYPRWRGERLYRPVATVAALGPGDNAGYEGDLENDHRPPDEGNQEQGNQEQG